MKKQGIRSLITAIVFAVCIILPQSVCLSAEDQHSSLSGVPNRELSVDFTRSTGDYSAILYNSLNGLPTSEANAIAETSDGFIWIGSYAGLIRYDGNTFERMDSTSGVGSVTSLYVDNTDRLWIGTNDSGIAMMEKGKFRKWGKQDGLSSTHVRTITMDSGGTVYAATTCGIAMISPDGSLSMMRDERIAAMNMRYIRPGFDGNVYGLTNFGDILSIRGGEVELFIKAEDNPFGGVVSSYVPDPENPGKLYMEGADYKFYRVTLGETITDPEPINIKPLSYIEDIEYIDGKLWLCASNGIGYLENGKLFMLDDLPMNNNVCGIMTDYLGNLWFTSTRQGVMKVVPNRFADFSGKYDLPESVVNTTCMSGDMLFVGTDTGLIVLKKNSPLSSLMLTKAETASGEDLGEYDLIKLLNGCRIRSVIRDSGDRLWISTWRKHGLLRYDHGVLTAFTEKEGILSGGLRAVSECEDGSIIVAVTGGVNVIKGDKVTASYSTDYGIANTESLCVEEGLNGDILLGSNGDGIYVITESGLRKIGDADGLPSDIVMRMKRNPKRGLVWIVTSSAIAYMTPDYKVTTVSKFPYPNNFDLYENSKGDMWVLSSNGIYVVPADELIANEEINPVYYGITAGLPCIATANSYSELTPEGDLYISGSTGICKVNIEEDFDYINDLKAAVPFVYADGLSIYPDESGTITIPADTKKLTIPGYVFNYSLTDPRVSLRLDGFDTESTTVTRSEMTPLVYTNLSGGNYTFVMRISDSLGRGEKEITVPVVKKKKLREMLWFRIIATLAALSLITLAVMYIVRRRIQILEERNKETMRQNELLQESERKLKEQIDNISAIAGIYSSMYELDLEHNTYRELRSGYASVDSVASDGQTDLQKLVDIMIRKTVDESCIDDSLLKDIDLSTISERMRFTDIWTREVLNPAKQWRRGRIIVADRNETGKVKRILWLSEDIDREKRERDHLSDVAFTDSLTGLSNKAAYDENTRPLDEAIASGELPEFAVLMVDLNFLKKVNDTYGHERGNIYLINCANMVSRIYGADNSYRFGGDEYVVVLSGEDAAKAEELTAQFKREIEQLKNDPELNPWEKVSAAIGIAHFIPGQDHTVEEVFKRSDKAMYEDKIAMKAQRTD